MALSLGPLVNGQKEEPAAVRKEIWHDVFELAARTVHAGDTNEFAAGRRDAVNGVVVGKQNDSGRAPRASNETSPGGKITDVPVRLCGQIEAVELAIRGGNRDMLAVRRPDRLGRIFCALDLSCLEGGKGSNPKLPGVAFTGGERDARTIGGEHGTFIHAGRRRHVEPDGARSLAGSA